MLGTQASGKKGAAKADKKRKGWGKLNLVIYDVSGAEELIKKHGGTGD